jgi:hypothetical protein
MKIDIFQRGELRGNMIKLSALSYNLFYDGRDFFF